MSTYTLRLFGDSPLRTTLVDEATGYARYRIDTPMRFGRIITRIRKIDSPSTQSPPHLGGEDSGSGSGGDITDKKGSKAEEEEEGLPETGDEIARIYWKWFSAARIVFRGKVTDRKEFLPKVGKAKQSVVSRRVPRRGDV